MTTHTLGLLIGGLLPAALFSVSNLSMKAASNAGVGVGWSILCIGIGVSLMGMILFIIIPERAMNFPASAFSLVVGITWGLGAGLVTIAMNRYGASIGVLTPLFNMNTLLTVLLALWIFAEWKQVRIPHLLIGSILIVIGGTMVAKA